jgi:hypothetical protein
MAKYIMDQRSVWVLNLEHVSKKLLDSFDPDVLQLF